MQIPSEFAIFGITLYTQGLFLILGFLFSLYALWKEGRKDGFDEERLFDNYLLALVCGLLVSRVFHAIEARYLLMPALKHVFSFWEPGLDFQGFLLGFVLAGIILPRFFRWSLFRTLDIFSLALSFGGTFALLGLVALRKDSKLLLFAAVSLVFYSGFSFLRLRKLFSGAVFASFGILVLVLTLTLEGGLQSNLLFTLVLFTIILGVLVLRFKKYMSPKKPLPTELFNKLQAVLLKKDASLSEQNKLLEEEDPYMQDGRAEANADEVDDAYLEDTLRIFIQAQKNVVNSIRKNVQKALGKMSKGDYGVCERCGNPIDKARLEVMPEASLCQECARKAEASQPSS